MRTQLVELKDQWHLIEAKAVKALRHEIGSDDLQQAVLQACARTISVSA